MENRLQKLGTDGTFTNFHTSKNLGNVPSVPGFFLIFVERADSDAADAPLSFLHKPRCVCVRGYLPLANNAKDGAPHYVGDASEFRSLGHLPKRRNPFLGGRKGWFRISQTSSARASAKVSFVSDGGFEICLSSAQ